MPIQESIIESLAVKHIQNVGFSTQAKDFTQEERLVPNPHLVISKEIPAEEWQTLTPTQAIALGRVEKHVVKMTADSTTGTPGNEKAFYADAAEDIENPGTGLLSGFLVVPGSSLWIVELFEDNGSGTAPDYGSPIVLGKGSTWAIDAPTGVLWLESGTTLNAFTKPFWLVGHTFVGKILDIYENQEQTFDNLLSNSSFESWILASNVPDGWSKGTGATAEDNDAADVHFGGSSLSIAQVPGPSFFVRQDAPGFVSTIGSGWAGQDVTFSVYAKASGGTAQTVKLRIEDGVGSTEQLFSIAGNFERYKITHRMSVGSTRIRVFIAPEGFSAATQTINLWVDGAMLTFGSATVPWAPRTANDTYPNALGNDLSIGGNLGVVGTAIIGGATSVPSLNVNAGGITNAGAISGASTIAMGGALTGVTTISASGLITGNGLNNSSGGITNAGAISGATTISASGLITGNGLNNSSGGITNAGAISGASTIAMGGALTGVTTISASGLITGNGLNNSSGGITNAGAISGVTTIGASGKITAGSFQGPAFYFEATGSGGGQIDYDTTNDVVQHLNGGTAAGGLFGRIGINPSYANAITALNTLGGPNSLHVLNNAHIGGKLGIGVNPPKADFQYKDVLGILDFDSGANASTWFTRNIYYSGTYKRLVADNDAAMFGINAAGEFQYFGNTDANTAIDSLVSISERFSVKKSGQTTITMPGGGYNATSGLTVKSNVASASVGASSIIHNESNSPLAFASLSFRQGSNVVSPNRGADIFTYYNPSVADTYDLSIRQITDAGVAFKDSVSNIICLIGANGTIFSEGNFIGRSDNTSDLGGINNRFANLYMASTIEFAHTSEGVIGHAVHTTYHAQDTSVYGGNTTGGGRSGGDVNLVAGTATSGAGGDVYVTGGNAITGFGGNVYVGSGYGSSGEGFVSINGSYVGINDITVADAKISSVKTIEFDSSDYAEIKHGDVSSGSSDGFSLEASSTTSTSSGVSGGWMGMYAGHSPADGGSGGGVEIKGGNDYNTTPGSEGYGGSVYIYAGYGGINDRNGKVYLNGKAIDINGADIEDAKSIYFTSYNDAYIVHPDTSSNSADNMYIRGSSSTNTSDYADGGDVRIDGGDALLSDGGEGGTINIRGGDGKQSVEGYGGDVNINAGYGFPFNSPINNDGTISIGGKTITFNPASASNGGYVSGHLTVLTGTTGAGASSGVTLPTGFTSDNCVLINYEVEAFSNIWYSMNYPVFTFGSFYAYFSSSSALQIYHNHANLQTKGYRITLYRQY